MRYQRQLRDGGLVLLGTRSACSLTTSPAIALTKTFAAMSFLMTAARAVLSGKPWDPYLGFTVLWFPSLSIRPMHSTKTAGMLVSAICHVFEDPLNQWAASALAVDASVLNGESLHPHTCVYERSAASVDHDAANRQQQYRHHKNEGCNRSRFQSQRPGVLRANFAFNGLVHCLWTWRRTSSLFVGAQWSCRWIDVVDLVASAARGDCVPQLGCRGTFILASAHAD